MTNLSEIAFPAVLMLGLAALFCFVLILSIVEKVKETKYLTFTVYLGSKKDWINFDPDLYFYRMDSDEFDEAFSLFDQRSRKNKLRVRWCYETPSGRDHYQDQVTYLASDNLKSRLIRAQEALNDGAKRVEALNDAYANSLSAGREIDDDNPKIYCYRILGSKKHEMWVKVGYASKNAHRRIEQQFKTAARLEIEHEVLFVMPALTISGETFKDHAVHRELRWAGIPNEEGEWFSCSSEIAASAVRAVQQNSRLEL